MNPAEVRELMDSLDRDFTPRGKASAKPPAGPPPKHVLSRAKGQGSGADGAQAGAAAPSTPPDSMVNLPLRRSCIKRKTGSRFTNTAHQGKTPRITWPQGQTNTHYVAVESFRHFGEQLWYHMPGAMVFCDTCDKQVPQSMGALQGEPNRPQFAQNQFLCSDCLQMQHAGQ